MPTKYCNRCGKKLSLFDLQQKIHIHKKLEYGSKHDGEMVDIWLCNDCLDELIDDFCCITPTLTNINNEK